MNWIVNCITYNFYKYLISLPTIAINVNNNFVAGNCSVLLLENCILFFNHLIICYLYKVESNNSKIFINNDFCNMLSYFICNTFKLIILSLYIDNDFAQKFD